MKTTVIIPMLLISAAMHGQTIQEVRSEIRRQKLPHGDIVLAQARLESGNFTSRRAREDHNILGMKNGSRYAKYRRWQDCIADYRKRVSSRYKGGDYYAFLRRIGYASDESYIEKLRRF